MPCSCQKPLPDYPESDHWGPVLWTIMHSLAQKGGKAVFSTFYDDERRQWLNLFSVLPKMIPCAMCRQHTEEWIASHPVTVIKTIPYDQLGPWLIDWLYTFHEAVNARTGKPPFDRTLLDTTYNSTSIEGAMRILKPFIETAIRLSGITLFPWTKFIGFVKILCSIYGI